MTVDELDCERLQLVRLARGIKTDSVNDNALKACRNVCIVAGWPHSERNLDRGAVALLGPRG